MTLFGTARNKFAARRGAAEGRETVKKLEMLVGTSRAKPIHPCAPSHSLRSIAVLVALVGAGALLHASLTESLVGRQVFPVTNWWNQDVSTAPVDSNSAAYINYISGRTGGTTPVRRLHPDFGPPP